MLFNSYEFIFLLLPMAFVVGQLLAGNYRARVGWLLACSLFFYAWWNPIYLPLLLGTILFNFVVGARLRVRPSRWMLAAGVTANLSLIAYFKYAEFFSNTLVDLLDTPPLFGHVALPLAISFFTFQQIAYLADCYSGLAPEYRPSEYALFVSFFPQLIAGPIVHHSEVMPQLRSPERDWCRNLSVGGTIFALGLFKKTVLADGVAPYANALFDDPQAWASVSFLPAWIGVLAYALQIYFDFSGYSDMAIGAARMFGIKLPLNFFAPYRSETISEFWRRWHMTLSHFLRDYLYIPLGGNRFGTLGRYRNLMITMLLGGLWHGAGWTFVLWGALHGSYLIIQHGWSHATSWLEYPKKHCLYRLGACVLTFIAVDIAWAYFRASSLASANQIVLGMLGYNGVSYPSAIALRMGKGAEWLSQIGIGVDGSSGTQFVSSLLWLAGLSAIVWLMPTTQQFMRNFEPAWEYTDATRRSKLPDRGFGVTLPLVWTPSLFWSLAISFIAVAGILTLPELSEFLYFQF
ncbi:MBOAT family O-acyltransferase [Aureliella helgolandensis]|uniref:Peptidoglycan O-acetyltransferase n=1 Tax=Aureliella helgolandensis TaxID=2527968 RepID=A0A518GDZ5_9BACT|nr:MBOAT family O-acyltransferase [Aureliella helgolandensis]QDV26819.1 Peptidoglycan O-acetyltransferase [Aureliella helgolandensis]